ncbi:aldehyde dehydrogenase family protein [Abyssibius alkaniclasticus]|uniref:aldehyde dehydrogenase family protein n=1 Tax=Abyssibius alkaniclasticus TaxID=2881234 RepID=UPI002364A1B5|nr:aldehyde dehydrogenase family protein [Abyssibius alkaniclasticus]UPH69831.1 aldehyde dehydrogenase family protein [Abyssibius alkaniclasticus]
MHNEDFYINGAWVKPNSPARLDVINPATEAPCATIALANQADVDAAFGAARAAFPAFSQTSKAERLALMREILAQYEARAQDMADAIRTEMGAPAAFAMDAQVWAGSAHIGATIEALEKMAFESRRGDTLIMHEAIGVAALITPWNWPMNQIACKVAPALAAGCTMVLKPSEIAPLSGLLFSEIMHKAGVPAGVYNMINGDGPVAGNAMSGHAEADMVSFTGSTRAGILVAKNAADTVKRVAQELGGKSANILLDDVDLEDAVTGGVDAVMANSGQSCDAPTRMLVPAHLHDRACDIAAAAAAATIAGDPQAETTTIGPVISQQQFDKVQGLIEAGLEDGARLVAGGPGRPAGLNQGYYVRPTVFGDVRPGMRIEREEIFGPVLSIMPYETEDDAVRMANDTVYGLAAYVQGKDMARVRRVARQLRAGQVQINAPEWDLFAPFGGYKQSGNGREYADWGIHDFLEVKALIGHG